MNEENGIDSFAMGKEMASNFWPKEPENLSYESGRGVARESRFVKEKEVVAEDPLQYPNSSRVERLEAIEPDEVGIVYNKTPSPWSTESEKVGREFASHQDQKGEEGDMDCPPDYLLGMEEVFIAQPQGMYPNSPIPFSNMKLKDAIPFVGAEITKAFDQGDYSILDHYRMVAEQSEFVDEGIKAQVRSLAEEGKKITNADEAKAFLEKLNTFLFSLKVQWKKEE